MKVDSSICIVTNQMLNDFIAPPPRPPRPTANPDLFKTHADSLGDSTTSAQVQRGIAPKAQASPSAGATKAGGKWQPLTSLEPKAELEDHDPFSLGDSDEEPAESTKKDVKAVEGASAATKKPDAVEPTTSTTAEKKAGDSGKS